MTAVADSAGVPRRGISDQLHTWTLMLSLVSTIMRGVVYLVSSQGCTFGTSQDGRSSAVKFEVAFISKRLFCRSPCRMWQLGLSSTWYVQDDEGAPPALPTTNATMSGGTPQISTSSLDRYGIRCTSCDGSGRWLIALMCVKPFAARAECQRELERSPSSCRICRAHESTLVERGL